MIDGATFGQAILRDGETLTFTFDAPIFVFGIDTSKLGNVGLATSIMVAGESFTPAQDAQSLIFSGVISDAAFSTVSFVFDAGSASPLTAHGFAFDNVSYTGAAVAPLPAGLPLLVGALGAIGWLGRGRRAT